MPSVRSSFRLSRRARIRLGYVSLGLVLAGVAAATYAIALPAHATRRPHAVVARSTTTSAPPSAAEFAEDFVGATNQYARAKGDPTRISHPHCIRTAQDHALFMCAYTATKPGAPSKCYLMQARWTPDAESSFTVLLAGRTTRCGSLREAVHSLR